MDWAGIYRGLVRRYLRRNVVCAFIAFPVILLLIIVSSTGDDKYYTRKATNANALGRDGTDVMFDIVKLQNHKPPVTHGDTQTERASRINRVCQKMDVPGTVKGLYLYNNVTYCYNYKVASTYWIQIYRFLYHDVSYNVSRPSQISKYEAHLVEKRKIRLRYLFSLNDQEDILSSFRFMMVRDPYSRLWSVFVDKFILLDHYFWSRYSPEMRRSYLHPEDTLKDIDTTKRPTIRCLHITFTEFLNYVAIKGKMKPENLDDHMRPIHYGCNPCFYAPNYVGKVEAMTLEKTPVLQKLGLNNSDGIDDFKSHVVNEISMISDFEFKLWNSFQKTYGKCVTYVTLERKMIQAFIINGYLPEDVWTQFHGLLPLGQKRFKSKVIEVFSNSFRNSTLAKSQRARLRKEAYSNVPFHVLDKIRNLFRYDFELFGYDPSPGYIFGNRNHESNR